MKSTYLHLKKLKLNCSITIVISGAVALAVRRDSNGNNTNHVVMPSALDPDNKDHNSENDDGQGFKTCYKSILNGILAKCKLRVLH